MSGTRILVIASLLAMLSNAQGADDSFKPVAEILQRQCLSCHNSVDRKGDFSLQLASELFESGYVDPGDSAASHLVAAITSTNGKPPAMPKNGKPLSQKEVAAIKKWIDAGAKWPDEFRLEEPVVDDFDWWSLQSIVRPSVPALSEQSDRDWIRTPIDAFIASQHQRRGLIRSPEADRRTLIRRLTFDLIGLPPTPAEVNAFVNDADPQAYERLVDRLLASPQYGERWARHWLDVVKYADTCGYDKDKLRPNAWPYRDYVIRSINNDKPYARFVREQIAGDVLYPGTADGILGLGFIAAGPWDFIGHVEVPEAKIDGMVARHTDRDEMVTNTLNTFCSTTIQCAQCHNHKFDPFTQQHYYSLQAVFAAVDRAERVFDESPSVERQRIELQTKLDAAKTKQRTLEAEIATDGGKRLAELEKQVRDLKPRTVPKAKRPEYGYHSNIVKSANVSKWVEVDLEQEVDVTKIVLRPCHDEFNGIGSGFGFPVRYRVTGVAADSNREVVLLDRTARDVPNPLLSPVEIQAGRQKLRTIRVTATKLALRSNDYMLALAEVQVFDASGKNVALKKTVRSLDSIQAPVRWARKNLTDGIWPAGAEPNAQRLLEQAQAERDKLLAKVMTPERVKRRDEVSKQIASLDKQIKALPKGRLVYSAATNFNAQGNFKPTMGKPRTIRFLHRGNITQPRDEVSPGTIPLRADDTWQFDFDAGHDEGDRRARLANWITDTNNPLTWRSIVNRLWLYHFGRGLVNSPNDFGRMGQLPTHPELLDWLAAEFRDNGQSFKHIHRLIVTSAVYRQASVEHAANAKIDSGNQYLWRMNRRRLEAEEIRDAILSVSGRMHQRMGGPGYYLFVLERTAHSPHYEYHKFDPSDAASHRRSVYRFIVRSQPDPFMTTLDCADSSQSTPKRDETLTSLQALSLLNNRFNLEMARRFAERIDRQGDDLGARVNRAFQLVTARQPTRDEQRELTAYAASHGTANLCRVLFNLSEFVYLD